jgi:hypothetical protein
MITKTYSYIGFDTEKLKRGMLVKIKDNEWPNEDGYTGLYFVKKFEEYNRTIVLIDFTGAERRFNSDNFVTDDPKDFVPKYELTVIDTIQ